MNTITTASTNTILAIDLGKYKSVACVHDRDGHQQAAGEIGFTTFEMTRAELVHPRAATVKRKRAAWSRDKSQGSDGQHQKEEKYIFSRDGSRLDFSGHCAVRLHCSAPHEGHS